MQKHIKNKHEDELNEKFNQAYFRGQARDNFLDDPNSVATPAPTVTDPNRPNAFGGPGGRPFERRDGQPFERREGQPFERREGQPFERREFTEKPPFAGPRYGKPG